MSLLLGNGYQHDCYVIGTSISDSFTGDFVTCVLKLRGDWIDLNIFRACEMVKRNEQFDKRNSAKDLTNSFL